MTKKWSISFIALFMFVLSFAIGFYSTGNTLSDPGGHLPLGPGPILYSCCTTPNGGTGVVADTTTGFCSCTGAGVEGGYNPNNCPLDCGEPQ